MDFMLLPCCRQCPDYAPNLEYGPRPELSHVQAPDRPVGCVCNAYAQPPLWLFGSCTSAFCTTACLVHIHDWSKWCCNLPVTLGSPSRHWCTVCLIGTYSLLSLCSASNSCHNSSVHFEISSFIDRFPEIAWEPVCMRVQANVCQCYTSSTRATSKPTLLNHWFSSAENLAAHLCCIWHFVVPAAVHGWSSCRQLCCPAGTFATLLALTCVACIVLLFCPRCMACCKSMLTMQSMADKHTHAAKVH